MRVKTSNEFIEKKEAKKMKPIVPDVKDMSQVLKKTKLVAHASKCGTCACKCACRYNNLSETDPFED